MEVLCFLGGAGGVTVWKLLKNACFVLFCVVPSLLVCCVHCEKCEGAHEILCACGSFVSEVLIHYEFSQ